MFSELLRLVAAEFLVLAAAEGSDDAGSDVLEAVVSGVVVVEAVAIGMDVVEPVAIEILGNHPLKMGGSVALEMLGAVAMLMLDPVAAVFPIRTVLSLLSPDFLVPSFDAPSL